MLSEILIPTRLRGLVRSHRPSSRKFRANLQQLAGFVDHVQNAD